MKKIIVLCALVLQLFAEEAFWYDMYDEALEESVQEHKPMLVFVSQFGCKGCEYMEDKVLFKEDVATYLDENYIALHIDIRDKTTPEKFKIGVTPAFFFMDEKGNIMYETLVGATAQDEFLEALIEANEDK